MEYQKQVSKHGVKDLAKNAKIKPKKIQQQKMN